MFEKRYHGGTSIISIAADVGGSLTDLQLCRIWSKDYSIDLCSEDVHYSTGFGGVACSIKQCMHFIREAKTNTLRRWLTRSRRQSTFTMSHDPFRHRVSSTRATSQSLNLNLLSRPSILVVNIDTKVNRLHSISVPVIIFTLQIWRVQGTKA